MRLFFCTVTGDIVCCHLTLGVLHQYLPGSLKIKIPVKEFIIPILQVSLSLILFVLYLTQSNN